LNVGLKETVFFLKDILVGT